MRIVIAVEEFDPDKGYLEYYLAKELTKLGHKVYIFTFGWSKGHSRTMLKEGFEVVNIPYFATVYGYHVPNFDGVAYILRFIKMGKPDIIHCQPLDSPLSICFIVWKDLFKYKIVGSIMTQLNMIFSPWDIKKKTLFSLAKIIVTDRVKKRSEIIFAKTGELAKLISRSYDVPQNKFRIIPLGSDPELFKFDLETRVLLRKKLGLSENDIVIVYSGKIDPSKRLDVFVKALAPIVLKNNKVKLLIVGKGEFYYVKYLKMLISNLKITNNVIFHPWVNRTMISTFYSASDIGTWPGLSSISIIDAVSTGLPVVIARYPVEIFAIENENGFAFEIDNVEELRKCLEILVRDDKLRKEMGCRSRLLVEQRLSWNKIVEEYLRVYNSISEERRGL
jgi:glycosyltransferase involved in cell wall biosynthesis